MMLLKLALDIATLPPMSNGLAFPPRFFGGDVIARGAAVILTSEDDQDEVHRRLASLDPTNARLGKPLYVVPMISAGGARSILADGPNGPTPTPFWYELRAQLAAIPKDASGNPYATEYFMVSQFTGRAEPMANPTATP